MPLDTVAFRASLSRFASGVTVLTTRSAEGQDLGMTATAFSSLSLDPPLVLVCIDHAASMAPALERATHLAVHVLGADQESVSRQFALKTGDRFAGLAVTRGAGDLPLLSGALVRLECRIVERHAGGDHRIVVCEVLAAEVADGDPLLYFRGRYARLAP
jgi:flavin reductase (DIM6/NTAB) family NADH-FMN oxidoreductase RutF